MVCVAWSERSWEGDVAESLAHGGGWWSGQSAIALSTVMVGWVATWAALLVAYFSTSMNK